jgi:hypothetical protein
MKKHTGFIIFFTAVIFIFLWKVIFMKAAFLAGDYATQFYPWSRIYSQAIKNFHFPYWTRLFHSGFPLMAEGQVGGFYPLNLVFFFFLPFKTAYNYIVVFHFILAGIFTYIYTRKLGACQWGGALAALLFCFGSAYAGCFYNTVTMKALIWVPLVLYLCEKYFDGKNLTYMVAAGIVLGVQLLAGFAQVAVYSALFYLIYFIYGLFVRKDLNVKDAGVLGGAFVLAAILFLPQFALSWPLVGLSGRSGASLGFALWGSFNPFNFMSTVFPYWVSHGTRFYIGIFGVIFFITALKSMKSAPRLRPLLFMLLVSVFFALGKYNPLYVMALKAFRFYSFRNPSKFLFFGMFAASVLSGWGFTEFFKVSGEVREKVLRVFSAFLVFMLGLFFLAKGILVIFGRQILHLGEWYVSNQVYGKEFHRHDFSFYTEKVRNFYENLVQRSMITEPFVMASVVLCALALIFSIYIIRTGRVRSFFKGALGTVILLDLFIFSFYGIGFSGNIQPFETLKPDKPSLYDIVSGDKGLFRILPYGIASWKLPNWAVPNANATYGIDSAGAYTPLVADPYYIKLKGLEVVDNSLGLLEPEQGSLEENKELLRVLNVKYIISPEEIKSASLKRLGREEGIYLYELSRALGRGFFIRDIREPVKAVESSLRVTEYRPGYATFSLNAPTDGFFVFSEFNYPGWQATIDGKRADIRKFKDILMALAVSRGRHEIEFRYKPFKR